MKIKMGDAVRAYQAAEEMGRQMWPFETALALAKVKRALRDEVSVYLEQERDLMEQCAEKDAKGNVMMTGASTFRYKSREAAETFLREHRALDEQEIELDFTERKVTAPDNIRADHLEALEGFLAFG